MSPENAVLAMLPERQRATLLRFPANGDWVEFPRGKRPEKEPLESLISPPTIKGRRPPLVERSGHRYRLTLIGQRVRALAESAQNACHH